MSERIFFREQVLFEVKGEHDFDIMWFRAQGISSSPRFDDVRLFLHQKAPCCGGFIRVVKSFFKNDFSGRGRQEAHYAYCECGVKICDLPHEITEQSLKTLIMPFGKHKGMLAIDLPMDYLDWCSKNLENKFAEKLRLILKLRQSASS